MNLEETKKWLLENLISKKGKLIGYKIRFNGECIKEVNPDVYNSIVYHSNHLPFECKFQQRVYDILNDIHETVMCDFCKKNQVTFIKYSQGYVKCCSHSCAQCHPDTREKIEKSCMKNYGVKHSMQSPIVQEKAKKTNLELYGVEWILCDPNAHKKAVETNLEKYGVENCSQREDIKRKKVETSLRNYGVKCPNSLKWVQTKIKNSKLKRYGNPNFVNPEKARKTNRIKYGCDHPFQNPEVWDKVIRFYQINFGVTHNMHVPEIAEKCLGWHKNSWHEYTLPSGEIIKLQGYEPKALDYLLTKYNENEILYKKSEMPTLFYIGEDNKTHRYYPDFYIPKDNLIIEVKSWFTYTNNLISNLLKEDGVLGNNYKYKIMIF